MDLHAPGALVAWSELPADALSEIAGHLHDAGDRVCFRAVCRPWRSAPPPVREPSFLPYLVESCGAGASSDDVDPGLRLHAPFSTRKIRPLLPLPALRGKKIERSDASGGRVLATGYSNNGILTPELVNPLTGDATSLPPLPRSVVSSTWWRARGVLCRTGAVVFHTEQCQYRQLEATLLRPGELDWEEVGVTCYRALISYASFSDEHHRSAAALCSSTVLPGAACAIAELPRRHRWGKRYVLEFHGELLCVDIVIPGPFKYQLILPESVSVLAMQAGDDGRPRWVEREHGRGDTTDHLCFFLSTRGSFAVDAREFPGSTEVTAGCAYFFSWHPESTKSKRLNGVFRYSFQDGTTTLVHELPTFFYRFPMWFIPRPRISALPCHDVRTLQPESDQLVEDTKCGSADEHQPSHYAK